MPSLVPGPESAASSPQLLAGQLVSALGPEGRDAGATLWPYAFITLNADSCRLIAVYSKAWVGRPGSPSRPVLTPLSRTGHWSALGSRRSHWSPSYRSYLPPSFSSRVSPTPRCCRVGLQQDVTLLGCSVAEDDNEFGNQGHLGRLALPSQAHPKLDLLGPQVHLQKG